MNPVTVEKEVLELERQYWQAMQDRNLDAALKLTEFPGIVAGPSGVMRIERADFEKMMKSATYRIRKVELDPNAQVRLLRDDVAVVAYKASEEVVVDGKKMTVDVVDSSTWIKRGGQWLCAMHSEAISGDPWGRDRTSTTPSAE
ncbi:MAG TPA: nuclear transport factor 2 family protein [Polyangiaceae bacterium]|jgi:hypothetical protein|nr:nuclear transport factor 2 family protein [Polyangiaceae bacterium]